MAESRRKPGIPSLISRPLLAGAIATSALVPATSVADTFLKLDGIKGESTDEKHKDEIQILSYTQSFRQTGVTSGGGGGAGKVVCGNITVLKNIDKASPLLIQHVVQGKHIPKGVITFRTVGGDQPSEYYTVTLDDVLIMSIDQTDNPDPGRIVEKIVLNAAEFKFSYRPIERDGKPGPAVEFGWDCKANSKV